MTGYELFDKAIDLCGLGSASENAPTDVSDLQLRAVRLINILLAENSILDCKIRKCRHSVESISLLDDRICCSEIIGESVLPYGLARLFLLGEDDAASEELYRIYTINRNNALRFGNAVAHSIREVYK